MDAFFTKTEKAELTALYRRLMQSAGDSIAREDAKKLKNYLMHLTICQRAYICTKNKILNN